MGYKGKHRRVTQVLRDAAEQLRDYGDRYPVQEVTEAVKELSC